MFLFIRRPVKSSAFCEKKHWSGWEEQHQNVEKAPAHAHHWTDAFAPGQMLTFDLGSNASEGSPPSDLRCCSTAALLSNPTHAEATAHYLQYMSLNFLLLDAGILY